MPSLYLHCKDYVAPPAPPYIDQLQHNPPLHGRAYFNWQPPECTFRHTGNGTTFNQGIWVADHEIQNIKDHFRCTLHPRKKPETFKRAWTPQNRRQMANQQVNEIVTVYINPESYHTALAQGRQNIDLCPPDLLQLFQEHEVRYIEYFYAWRPIRRLPTSHQRWNHTP